MRPKRCGEFGIRLAIGAPRLHLLTSVLGEGAFIAFAGILAGALGGFALVCLAGGYFEELRMPGILPIIASAILLLVAAVVASVLPAARAARADVTQALRSE